MFGLKNYNPPNPYRHRLYEEELDVEPGAVRIGRKDSKDVIGGTKQVLRVGIRDVIKARYGCENVDPRIINSELESYDKVFADGKKLEEQEKIQNQEYWNVWVELFNVPLEYWNSKGITLIANEIGKPMAMDNVTQKMCNEH
ncbi:unnamed protein product [Lactuca saligna]|uniref:DUF4283 domain-containing protein n=1 Tax=Lactuca saligna TaxID=75948 RepID=A0AA36A2U4_LACSI|nr:unnamed protein product [Lactuca saligna]